MQIGQPMEILFPGGASPASRRAFIVPRRRLRELTPGRWRLAL